MPPWSPSSCSISSRKPVKWSYSEKKKKQGARGGSWSTEVYGNPHHLELVHRPWKKSSRSIHVITLNRKLRCQGFIGSNIACCRKETSTILSSIRLWFSTSSCISPVSWTYKRFSKKQYTHNTQQPIMEFKVASVKSLPLYTKSTTTVMTNLSTPKFVYQSNPTSCKWVNGLDLSPSLLLSLIEDPKAKIIRSG